MLLQPGVALFIERMHAMRMIDVSPIERVTALDEDLGSVSIDDFAVLWAAHERLGARLALTIARFDAGREYAADDGGLAAFALPDVRPRRHRLVARGRFLRDHDIVAEAATTSTLSAGQINAFRSNVTRAVETVFDEHAKQLIAIIAPLDVRSTEQACRVWRQHPEAISEQPEPVVPERRIVTNCSPTQPPKSPTPTATPKPANPNPFSTTCGFSGERASLRLITSRSIAPRRRAWRRPCLDVGGRLLWRSGRRRARRWRGHRSGCP